MCTRGNFVFGLLWNVSKDMRNGESFLLLTYQLTQVSARDAFWLLAWRYEKQLFGKAPRTWGKATVWKSSKLPLNNNRPPPPPPALSSQYLWIGVLFSKVNLSQLSIPSLPGAVTSLTIITTFTSRKKKFFRTNCCFWTKRRQLSLHSSTVTMRQTHISVVWSFGKALGCLSFSENGFRELEGYCVDWLRFSSTLWNAGQWQARGDPPGLACSYFLHVSLH